MFGGMLEDEIVKATTAAFPGSNYFCQGGFVGASLSLLLRLLPKFGCSDRHSAHRLRSASYMWGGALARISWGRVELELSLLNGLLCTMLTSWQMIIRIYH